MGRKFGMDFDKLQSNIKKEEEKGTPQKSRDERFYDIPWNSDKSKFDATIRFLPPKDNDSPPRIKYQYHAFKGKAGKFFMERCLKDIGNDCPVCEYTWNTYNEVNQNKDIWKERCGNMTNKTKYVSNILVVDDKKNPENNGKVFLYAHPQTVADQVFKKIQGEKDEDGSWLRKPVNVFDYYDGCNYKLKGGTNKGGFPDYSDCYFLDPSELFEGNDDKIEEVHNQLFDLTEFVKEDNYKDYGVVKAKLNRILGIENGEEGGSEDEQPVNRKKNDVSFTQKKSVSDDEEKKKIEDNFKAVTGSDKEVKKDDSDIDLNMVDDDDDDADDFLKKLQEDDD